MQYGNLLSFSFVIENAEKKISKMVLFGYEFPLAEAKTLNFLY